MLLPVPYFHFVFRLPPVIGAMSYQNKAKIYGLLFKAASDTLITIAADHRHLGADIGVIAVLHTWGQNLQHHPHVHCVVPGGWHLAERQALDCQQARILSPGSRALAPVPTPVPGRSDGGIEAGDLQFFSDLEPLNQAKAFAATLASLGTAEWVVYAKRTFAGLCPTMTSPWSR